MLASNAAVKNTCIAVLLAFFAIPAFAQDPSASAPSNGGCGANESHFSVSTNKKDHPLAQPQAGKATVYVIEDIFNGPTMRVGLDGAWVGANKVNRIFSFPWIRANISCALSGNRAFSKRLPNESVPRPA